MKSIIKLEVDSKIHFVVVAHIQSIEIVGARENPQISIHLSGRTIEIPIYDLADMADVKKAMYDQYERDWQAYKTSKEENVKSINEISQSSLEPFLTKEEFRPSKSLLPYRGAKVEVVRKFSSFIFNCLNFYWSQYGMEGRKHIGSLSIPSLSESDHSIEHIFVSLMKDVKGFDVYSLYKKDFIQQLLIRSYDACKAVTKPIQGAYKPESDKILEVANDFVDKINTQIRDYYNDMK